MGGEREAEPRELGLAVAASGVCAPAAPRLQHDELLAGAQAPLAHAAGRSPAAHVAAGGAGGGGGRCGCAGARERRPRVRPRSTTARRPWPCRRRARAASSARAARQSIGTAARRHGSVSSSRRPRHRRSACDRCDARPRRSPARAAARPSGTAPRRRTRTGRRASRRRGRRSRLDLLVAASSRSAAAIRRGMSSCTGANADTSRPAQPRLSRPASTSSRALPLLAVTTPIVRGRAGRRVASGARTGRRRRSGAAGARAGRGGHPHLRPAAPVTAKVTMGNEVALPG